MEWNIIFEPDFRIWFYQQEQGFQDEAFAVLGVLAEFGPALGRPRVDTLEGSGFNNMNNIWKPLRRKVNDKIYNPI
jgi:hypothetical protein